MYIVQSVHVALLNKYISIYLSTHFKRYVSPWITLISDLVHYFIWNLRKHTADHATISCYAGNS